MLSALVVALALVNTTMADRHEWSSPEIGSLRTVAFDTVWSFDLTGSESVEFINTEFWTIHGNLVGAVAHGANGLVLYDEITETLQYYSPSGALLWSAGQVGDGPNDHRPPCEPFVLDDGRIALASYAPQSKLVYYAADGSYLDTDDLPGTAQYHRLCFTNRRLYGITDEREGHVSIGTEISVLLTAFDEDFFVRKSLVVNQATWKTWRPGDVVDEADFWILPRMEDAGRGRILVQSDVYRPIVTIYDSELEEVATIDAGWNPAPRPQGELTRLFEESNRAKRPAPTKRALRHAMLVNDEIWLQHPRTDGRLIFRAYGLGGSELGDREIAIAYDETVQFNCRLKHMLFYRKVIGDDGGIESQRFSLVELEID